MDGSRSLLVVPPGLAGPDMTALTRGLLAELRRPGVLKVVVDLGATTAVRRLARALTEPRRLAPALGVELELRPPRHPAARTEWDRRIAEPMGAPLRRDDLWSL